MPDPRHIAVGIALAARTVTLSLAKPSTSHQFHRLSILSMFTYLPHINNDIFAVRLSRRPLQDSNSKDIVQPLIIRMSHLKHTSKQRSSIRLRRSRSLNININTIVRPQVISRVRKEDPLGIRQTPVGAEIGHRSGKTRTFEGPARDGNHDAAALAVVADLPALSQRCVDCVEEFVGWSAHDLGCSEEGIAGNEKGASESHDVIQSSTILELI
ncbi:hypothetical protein HG530_006685 [Fusarium avenaceum]|nr:hypothetical protein HG530_006685 [Fusarium avenaceum]